MSHPPQRPGGRGSNIRGPQSALTDFLAAHNIDANLIRRDADVRRAAAVASRQAAEGEDDEAASPSVEPEAPPARKNETVAQKKKRKKDEEKAIAKIKASKQFQRRRRGYDPDDLTDEDEAAFAVYKETFAPLPGQMENCEICDTRFTVTAYSRKGPAGGLLCPKCSKELDAADKDGGKKRKAVATRGGRRKLQSNILDGTFKTGAKDLMTLCIETLAKNVELAEDFGDLPQNLVDKLEAIISKNRLLTPTTLTLFTRPEADKIAIHEGAKLNSDDYIRIFQMVPNIAHLYVRNAIQFKNKVMEYLIGCPVILQSFSIHGANLIDDEHWDSYLIEKGRHLRTLKIYHTDGHFGDVQLELLKATCPDLVSLKVSHNQKVTDDGLRHIAGLPCLQHLTLQIYKRTSSEAYIEILKNIGPGLQKFSLSVVNDLDDRVLEAIHENCRTLRKLRLTDNHTFTDAGFAKLFTDWHNLPLEYVDLHKCRHQDPTDPRQNPDGVGLGDAGFEALMAHSGQKLRLLNIESCRHISPEAMERVFATNKIYTELKHMDVSFVWSVNDFVVGNIFKSCPNLVTLKVFGNFGVTNFKATKGKILIGMPTAMGMEIEGQDE